VSVPEYYGKPERILRFERGNFHGSQKPLPIGYEPCSYPMGMAVHVDRHDDDTGDFSRSRKDSFFWYKKVIASNGQDLD